MRVFERMEQDGHEQVLFCFDRRTGLKATIAIHDTTLGPALGGCRMMAYGTEEAVLEDALRLSRGMTYKSAAAGVNHGGGKAVIWGDPGQEKSEELFRSLGRFVQSLQGRFITGTDMGTSPTDFVWARQETEFVVALPEEYGGSGDSSVITAYGVFRGMQAAAGEVWGKTTLKGRHVVVQGVGKVGFHLVDHLVNEGCRVTVSDMNPDNVQRVRQRHPDVAVAGVEEAFSLPCDVFSPCAVGGILNDDTVPLLRCRIVAGSANNQLEQCRHGDALDQRGILYCPDYVINAGGLIQVADELTGFQRDRAFRQAGAIADMLTHIFAIARRQAIPTYRAADVLAEMRIGRVADLTCIHVPGQR